MQIIEYSRWDHRIFCPVTGKSVFNEGMEPDVPTFRALWVEEVIDEPTIASPELAEAWATYAAREDVVEDGVDLRTFLSGIDQEGWVAFAFTSCGIACGPVSMTCWVVLDLQMEIDDEGETDVEAKDSATT